jgi:hypothetical protein
MQIPFPDSLSSPKAPNSYFIPSRSVVRRGRMLPSRQVNLISPSGSVRRISAPLISTGRDGTERRVLAGGFAEWNRIIEQSGKQVVSSCVSWMVVSVILIPSPFQDRDLTLSEKKRKYAVSHTP